jgi:hypothetical protein
VAYLVVDCLAPIPPQMLPRPYEDEHAANAQQDAESAQNRIDRGEVNESNHRQTRKQERDDDRNRDAKALPKAGFGILLHADRRNRQVDDK